MQPGHGGPCRHDGKCKPWNQASTTPSPTERGECTHCATMLVLQGSPHPTQPPPTSPNHLQPPPTDPNHLQCLLCVDMLWLHEPARLVGTDGYGTQIHRAQAPAYLLKHLTVTAVTCAGSRDKVTPGPYLHVHHMVTPKVTPGYGFQGHQLA